MTDRGPEHRRRLDALRRTVYAPGARPEDVAAYRRAMAEQEDRPAPAAPVGGVRRPVRLPVLVGAGAALLVAVVAASLLPRPAAPTPTAGTPAPAVPARPALGRVPTAPAARTGFVAALVEGREAGLSAWLDAHTDALPGPLATATRSDTLEFAGDGRRVLRLDPPSVGPAEGGRVTVLLVAAADARLSWTLSGTGTTRAVVPREDAVLGEVTAGSTAYAPGRRPDRLQVLAPPGVRWGVAAVFSD